jgi:hypothetical protein
MKTSPTHVLTMRCTVKREHVAAVEAAIEQLLANLERERPRGIRYAWSKLGDGETFVGVLELDNGVDNPLPGIPGSREFQDNLKQWVREPPTREELTLVGSFVSSASLSA